MTTDFDLTEILAPKSDQANADDFVSGPRTFTITDVRQTGSPEQPVAVYLAEFPDGRPFKPSKSMARVMTEGWGNKVSVWVGKRMTLYRDPNVKFGKDKVGGIRISHMSGLPGGKRLEIPLTVTRGKRAPYVVEPLPDNAPSTPSVSDDTLADLVTTLRRKGIPEDKWLAGVNAITKGAATGLEVITEEQARKVLTELDKRPDAEAGA